MKQKVVKWDRTQNDTTLTEFLKNIVVQEFVIQSVTITKWNIINAAEEAIIIVTDEVKE